MEKMDFVRRIYTISNCKDCPIYIYCGLSKTISCTGAARKYYETHGRERIKWEVITTPKEE